MISWLAEEKAIQDVAEEFGISHRQLYVIRINKQEIVQLSSPGRRTIFKWTHFISGLWMISEWHTVCQPLNFSSLCKSLFGISHLLNLHYTVPVKSNLTFLSYFYHTCILLLSNFYLTSI